MNRFVDSMNMEVYLHAFLMSVRVVVSLGTGVKPSVLPKKLCGPHSWYKPVIFRSKVGRASEIGLIILKYREPFNA